MSENDRLRDCASVGERIVVEAAENSGHGAVIDHEYLPGQKIRRVARDVTCEFRELVVQQGGLLPDDVAGWVAWLWQFGERGDERASTSGGVAVSVTANRVEECEQPVLGGGRGVDGLAPEFAPSCQPAFERTGDEAVLAREVGVQRRGSHLGTFENIIDARSADAVSVEQLVRRVEEALSGREASMAGCALHTGSVTCVSNRNERYSSGTVPMGSGFTSRRGIVGGGALVVLSCACVQGAAAVSSTLFASAGVVAVAGLRQLVAAVILVLVVRPRVRQLGRREWAGVVVYGGAMATMNVAFYEAVDRVPLGVAATLLYLGPFAVATAMVRRRWELLLPLLGLAGVVLVSRPYGGMNWTGVGFGLLAAAALATYTVFAQRVGQAVQGLTGVALSVSVAALALLPASAPAVPELRGHQWLIIAFSGVVGVALAFTLDFLAVRLATARVVATLFALDPVLGALIGAWGLDEQLTVAMAIGIALVVTAGAGVSWLSGNAAAEVRATGSSRARHVRADS